MNAQGHMALVMFFAGLFTSTVIAGLILRSAVQRARVAEHAALTDALTSLPNRAGFFRHAADVVSRRAAASQPVLLGLLDLNGFKRVNDQWGHAIGDWALARVARSLQAALRDRGVVARLGGDEFGIVVPAPAQATDQAWVNDVGELVCAAVAEPLILIGYQLPLVTASVGLRLVTDPGTDVHWAVHEADVAMYYTKGSVREGFTVYDRDTMPDPIPLSRMQRPPVRVREYMAGADTEAQ